MENNSKQIRFPSALLTSCRRCCPPCTRHASTSSWTRSMSGRETCRRGCRTRARRPRTGTSQARRSSLRVPFEKFAEGTKSVKILEPVAPGGILGAPPPASSQRLRTSASRSSIEPCFFFSFSPARYVLLPLPLLLLLLVFLFLFLFLCCFFCHHCSHHSCLLMLLLLFIPSRFSLPFPRPRPPPPPVRCAV